MGLSGFAEKLIAGRWIAGATLDDAVRRSKQLNGMGYKVTLNYLGEALREKAEMERATAVYMGLINAIHRNRLNADISIKPTQIGVGSDVGYAKKAYSGIVSAARNAHVYTWLDMESHQYVDATIRLCLGESKKGMVGICIQSYLKRSASDIRRVVRAGCGVRLVKGAYSESSRIAYASRDAVENNYISLMHYLFRHSDNFIIATHDTRLIEEAEELNKTYRRHVEYAMLNGIRNSYSKMLVKRGESVLLYVPFGEKWLDYSYRRLRELGHLSLVLRSLLPGS